MTLTNHLPICPVLAVSNVHEVKQRLPTSESTREVFHQTRRRNEAGLRADIGEPFDVGIDADHDADISWNVNNLQVNVSPTFCNQSEEEAVGCLTFVTAHC